MNRKVFTLFIAIMVWKAAISQVPIGNLWYFLGDSETDGRARQTPSVKSQAIAINTIYDKTFQEELIDFNANGIGGCSLNETMDRYSIITIRDKLTWIHFQESGNQNETGQRTPQEFADTFEAFVRKIKNESPNAIISTETAYSFRRDTIEYRDWTMYNIALKNKISEMRGNGYVVYLAEVDTLIKILINSLSFSEVITTDGGHYLGVGNLLVALSIYSSLNYDVSKLNLEGIPESEVSTAYKNLCKSIVIDNNSIKKKRNKINKFNNLFSILPCQDLLFIQLNNKYEQIPFQIINIDLFNVKGVKILNIKQQVGINTKYIKISPLKLSAGNYTILLSKNNYKQISKVLIP